MIVRRQPDGEPALTPPLDAYNAQSALYNRLADETTTRNKAAVFDALAKAGIVHRHHHLRRL